MTTPDTGPNRTIAAILSLVWPGVGQAYLGRYTRAVVFFAVPIVALFVAALVARPLVAAHLGFIAVILALFSLGWQVIAAIDAGTASSAPVVVATGRRIAITFGFWLARIVVSVVASLTLRGYVVEAFKLPSGSMTPSLAVGDHVFVDKMRSGARPKGGEPIVFKFPERPEQDFVKRAIGFPGDSVRVDHGHATINGFTLPSCRVGTMYLEGDAASDSTSSRPADVFVEYFGASAYLIAIENDASAELADGVAFDVKPGEVFVLGDNRSNSHDSRMWYGGRGGGVPFDKIKGVPFVRWLTAPEKGVDWARIGGELAVPTLPQQASDLAPKLAECLASRPAVASATPPAR